MKLRELLKNLDRKGIRSRIQKNTLTSEDQRVLLFCVRVVPSLWQALQKSKIRVKKLREMIWGKKTESARNILKEIDQGEMPAPVTEPPSGLEAEASQSQESLKSAGSPSTQEPAPAQSAPLPADSNVVPIQKGKKYKENRENGLRGIQAYPDAEIVGCPHPGLKPGDLCPKCGKGTLYLLKTFGKFIQFVGSPFLKVILYFQQKLRCNACGAIFSAPLPAGVGGPRGTASASAMIALLKYGAGFPFYRLSQIQKYLKIPVSPSGIWKMLEPLIEIAIVIFKEMRRQAAQGEIFHNDDTVNKILAVILSLKLSLKKKTPEKTKKTRQKIFTSGILAKVGSTQIVLFFTGHRNAGENLEALFTERDQALKIPIQMSDASTMNTPGKRQTESSACLTHCRRYFVKSYRSAKVQVTYVIRKLKEVYRTESEAKKLKLSAEERLKLHQEKSGPILEELKKWMVDQVEGKKVEENSQLGEAIQYARNHWQKLTLFLRTPGAPLTNDELEQKFKMVKLHLKNSLFYKTLWGALVGDLFMSIIHTCVLAGENPLDYLIAIQTHRNEVLKSPGSWMPWSYRKMLPAAPAMKMPA